MIGRFGLAGTLLGAALFPVVVALVKELAARPARAVPTVRMLAVDRQGEGKVRRFVPSWTRRRAALAVGTGLLAFVLVVVGFTAVEAALGRSLVDDRSTTFFSDPRPTPPAPAPGEEEPTEPETEPAPPAEPTPPTESSPEPPPETEPPVGDPVPTEPPPTEPPAP